MTAPRPLLRPRATARPLARAALALVLLLPLVGCYLPVWFDAEVRISRQGYYDALFDGYLISLPFASDLAAGKLGAGQEKDESAKVVADLKRDSAVTQADYVRKGRFKVHWARKGDIIRQKMMTFVRRNEQILSLKYVKTTGMLTLEGRSLRGSDIQRLRQQGFTVQGELRVITPAAVASHNAQKVVRKGFDHIYVWKIKDWGDPAPKLDIRMR
ncbi:MAG: hypothetical protein H6907_17600 [Hyphomicrobiales bacterium]|nr:hypothetical protein [Hyphomicrobiales bacterium]